MFNPAGLNRMLDHHGVIVKLTQVTGQAYDPKLGSNVTTTEDTDILGYFYNQNMTSDGGDGVNFGGRYLALKATLSNGLETPVPHVGDSISYGGDNFRIVISQKIMSRNKVMVYLLQIEGT